MTAIYKLTIKHSYRSIRDLQALGLWSRDPYSTVADLAFRKGEGGVPQSRMFSTAIEASDACA